MQKHIKNDGGPQEAAGRTCLRRCLIRHRKDRPNLCWAAACRGRPQGRDCVERQICVSVGNAFRNKKLLFLEAFKLTTDDHL